MTDSEKLDLLLSEMQGMKTDIQNMKTDIQDTKADIQNMKTDIQDIQKHTTNIELTLENETNRNIKAIAEGHLDLSRKLNEALKVGNEKEMLLIRVNILENELRKVKDRLEQIA